MAHHHRLEPSIRLSPRRLHITLALVVLMLAAACNDGGDADPTLTPSPEPTQTSVPATPTPMPVELAEWESCYDDFECASIDVPLDYDDPDAGTIAIPLLRIPASDPDARIGSLLVNPGGPGESGVDFVRRASTYFFSERIRDRFDIVGFDPRGAGATEPHVDCTDDPEPYVALDPSPDSEAEIAEQQALAQALVGDCEAANGELLPHLASDNVARDMDVIRQALGDDKLTYAGFSYGTLIGALYADLFPQNVRALVLDGAVDPSLDVADDARFQIIGFERALTGFLDWCAADDACAFHDAEATAARFDALMARVEETPLDVDDGRQVGPGHAWFGVAGSLYDEASGWPVLGRALAAADDDNDGTLLVAIAETLLGRRADGSWNNSLEARLAINCVDSRHLTPAETDALLAELRISAPRFGPNSGLASGDACDYWPVPPQREAMELHAPGAAPIVVVGTTGDPATPYEHAVALADQLESGVLLTYVGEGHTAYRASNTCIAEAVDAYLIDLAVPADGTRCEP